MLEVTLTGVNGKEYLLTGSERTSEVLSPIEALTTLSGTSTRSDVPAPGRSGVIPGRTRFDSILTELEFHLHARTGEEMERVYREFRQGWNLYRVVNTPPPSVVKVDADHPDGPFYLDLWLDQPLAGVPVDMRRRTSATVMATVFNPKGLFRSETITGTNYVTIHNHGDGLVYPKLEYSGAGGQVTGPSGARFTLPEVEETTVVDLDPRKLRLSGAFPEGVEPKDTGTWFLPAGVEMSWNISVADPWA